MPGILHCEDECLLLARAESGERCQQSWETVHYTVSHPKEQSRLNYKICSMQYRNMNTDKVAIAACIMETDIAIMALYVRMASMWQLCSEKGDFDIPSAKVWNGLVCTHQQHLLLNKHFALHVWICTCDYPTSFIILMASTRCWGGG